MLQIADVAKSLGKVTGLMSDLWKRKEKADSQHLIYWGAVRQQPGLRHPDALIFYVHT